MSGYCRTFDHSVQKLPSSLRDKITSYSADSGDDVETPPSDVPDSDSSIGFTLN
jgi:hypothetical protein